ncbi:hypothetical protein FWF74_01975 [Candidatus Saccharibacteria bacterium]|nr:hypothetical protein [Candidatus Saccharibacteria bacterium]MCL1963427.1 hypothetical protein [Candidatus Saccharibacteria bacterium]
MENQIQPMGAVVEKKNNWKTVGIITIILSAIFAIVAGFFVWKSFDQQTKIDDLDNKMKQLQKADDNANDDITKCDDVKGGCDAKYLMYTTEMDGLSFDYPKDWSVEGKVRREWGDDLYQEITTIRTAKGYKLTLSNSNGGGAGGGCDPSEAPAVVVHKEAGGELNSMSVISYIEPDGSFSIYLSDYNDLYDQPINSCVVRWSTRHNHLGDHGDVIFGNASIGEKRPDDSEYSEIVKMLASLRQK